MYSRCEFITCCLAAYIVCNYEIAIVLYRNSAGGCHCITFSDSGRVPGTTEEDPRVQAQYGTKTHNRLLNQEYAFRTEPITINTALGRRGRGGE